MQRKTKPEMNRIFLKKTHALSFQIYIHRHMVYSSIYMYIDIWIVIYICTYIYIHMCVCVYIYIYICGFPGGTSGKEPACQCRRLRDTVSVPGWDDPLEKGMATHSSILAWRISWTKEPGELQSTDRKESDMTEAA